jgi:hypothetical protein
MAKPLEKGKVYDLSRENGLLTVDGGATSTLTRSLLNMTKVTPKCRIILPFAESEGLFYVETILISETKYKTMSGY